MNKNFKENLTKKIIGDISNDAVISLQEQLCFEAKFDINDIYEVAKLIEQNKIFNSKKDLSTNYQNKYEYSLALSVFMQKLLKENKMQIDSLREQYIKNQSDELGICKTDNPKFFLGKDNCYYSFNYDKYIKEDSIVSVEKDGSYITQEKIKNNKFNLIKIYLINDSVSYLYITDKQGNRINSLCDAIKLLGFKKEEVKKFKKIGYCGNSIDFWADLLNLFFPTKETGYYSDSKYNFYRWDCRNSRFIRQARNGLTPGAPNISDYENKDSKTIVRTDYTGSGLNLRFA